ncbi:MAG: thiamine pyrophosphate-binding protein [Acidimicrobiia bacterium]|nr:thiamine pyrophosphate-binding protein [Acidimicrobiia bacterium]MDH4305888.1 thiamine pyrophosphate-binding protein [Acidimicrobiia bacterium]
MTSRSGAHALVESLLAEGLTTLFGIPGVGTLPVYDAFLDHPALRHIETRHEQGAIFMADGYARASGDIGVAFTSGGPGSLNTLTAMATAFNDSSAVLHLVNENPASVRRKMKGHFHDMSDQFGIFRSVTDFGIQASLADEIPAAIHQAAFALRNRRPRPAIVEIAAEAFSNPTSAPVADRAIRSDREPSLDQVREAAALIAQASKPVIWSGGGVATAAAAEALQRLAERTGAAVITTQKGKGGLPADHPLHIGNWANERPVRDLIASSDLLIAVGTRFSYFPTGGWSLDIPVPIIQIDVDPSEIGRNYRVRAGVVGDAALSLEAIDTALTDIGFEQQEWRSADVADALRRIHARVGEPVEIQVLDQIRSALPHDALVFNDPTTIAFWARSIWKAYSPRTWFVPSGFGTLGSSLPTAIGAKVARPDTPCITIVGDAGIMFTIQDLMTAVQENIPVIVMVFNDRGYGVERRHQDHLYGRRNAVDLVPPDFVAVAEAFGARGLLVDDLSNVGATLESVLETDRPTLIEIPNQFGHPGYGSFANWDD